MYMYVIKLFAKNEKELETLKSNDDIQWSYRDGFCHIKVYLANNENRKTTYDERNRTTKSR